MKGKMLTIFAGVLLLATSCTKTGPQGPQGPTGATGATGNANVIGSDHLLVQDWQYSSTYRQYSATFDYPAITTNVANYGVVMIYEQFSDGSWAPLPDLNGVTSTVFNFSPGSFTIYILNTDGSVPASPGSITFRAVIIPSSLKQANPKANWKNYKETMAILEAAKLNSGSVNINQ